MSAVHGDVVQDDGVGRWSDRPAGGGLDARGARAQGAPRDRQQQRTQANAEHQRRLPVSTTAAAPHRARRPS